MKPLDPQEKARARAHAKAGRCPFRLRDGVIPAADRARPPAPGDYVVIRDQVRKADDVLELRP